MPSISSKFRSQAAGDDASANNCGRGVRNTLAAFGIPHLSRQDTSNDTQGYADGQQHGYRWANYLSSDEMKAEGWQEIDLKTSGITPENSPPGVVWVYPANDPPGSGGGAKYGHVEIATEDGFVAGGFSNKPGGTVRHNQPRAFRQDDLSKLFGHEGPLPEGYTRDRMNTALDQDVARRSEDGTLEEGYRERRQGEIDALNMDGLGIFGLIMMIFQLFAGKPLDPNADPSEFPSLGAETDATPPAEPAAESGEVAPAAEVSEPENPAVTYTPPGGSQPVR